MPDWLSRLVEEVFFALLERQNKLFDLNCEFVDSFGVSGDRLEVGAEEDEELFHVFCDEEEISEDVDHILASFNDGPGLELPPFELFIVHGTLGFLELSIPKLQNLFSMHNQFLCMLKLFFRLLIEVKQL